MKKNWLFLGLMLLFLAACNVAVEQPGSNNTEPSAQSNETQTSATARAETSDVPTTQGTADAAVKAIDSEKLRGDRKHYANPNPELYYDQASYTGYYRGQELVKLLEEGGEEGFLFQQTYYFHGGKVFFIKRETSYMSEDNILEQGRVYLKDEKIYAALGRKKPDDKMDDESVKISSFPEGDLSKDDFYTQKRVSESIAESQKRYKAGKTPD